MKRILMSALLTVCLLFTNASFAGGLRTLAVLDFQNNTGKTSLDYLSTGIPQMLITELSANGGVKVVERQRLQQALKELELEQTGIVGGESAREIGKMLGAELMIMGSFIKIGNNFRIDAHLGQVETGSIIGEKVMGSSVDDVMRLINELSAKIYNRVLMPGSEAGGESQVRQTGSLAISSSPDKAQVFLNGVSMGNTPVSMQGVKVGTHVVSMFINGYYINEQKVRVKPDQIELVSAEMKEIEAGKSGTLAISTKPGDALVVVDGLPLGSSPLTLNRLPIGEHTIKLIKEGYNPWEAKISLLSDKITTINVNLSHQGELGSLVVVSEPQGARVFLNGFLKGVTPITLAQLFVGDYELRLARKDYMAVNKKISVKKDEVASISAKL